MSNITLGTDHTLNRLQPSDLETIAPDVRGGWHRLVQRHTAGNDFTGWIDLPLDNDSATLAHIVEEAQRLQAISDTLVLIGIGGSYLGARMVIEALRHGAAATGRRQMNIVYAGHTLDEDYYCQLLEHLDRTDYSVIVVSKSGTTTEPAVAFRIVRNHLERKYGADGARHRIVAITDGQRGALHDIASREGYPLYVIPDNVGGRYSVLSPVGLLPIAAAGLDINKVNEGARDMRAICLDTDNPLDNPALRYAAVRNALYRRGVKVEILACCQPHLRSLAEWWKQLYGESEGKEGKGLLPHSLSLTTDLHSLGQYVQEGERLLMETFLLVGESASHVPIPTDPDDADGLNYLTSKSLTEINLCAAEATMAAHEAGGVPVMELRVERLDAYNIGSLIFFFEFACAVSGYTLGIDPFNQPGVEAYKRNMFHLLGRPGF